MKSVRLEAFSDGVLAIIITIMVLELKVPHEPTFEALAPIFPVLISYLVSFIYIAIYWNGHHHMFQITEKVNGKVLWANLHLLFWLSLIPFTTAWIGENHMESTPVAVYGMILFMSGVANLILKITIIKNHEKGSRTYKLMVGYVRELISLLLYLIGIFLAFLNTYSAIFCFIIVAVLWAMPNKKIEKYINNKV